MPDPASLAAPPRAHLRLVPDPALRSAGSAEVVAERARRRVAPATRRAPAPRAVRILRFPGVYVPEGDSRLLAEALADEDLAGARVLELCTGSGLLAATAARGGADVTAIDCSRRAALSARANLRLNGVRARVVRGDLLTAAPAGTFDLVVANPPYVPHERDAPQTRGTARHWAAGRSGRATVDRICAEAPGRLAPGGALLVVHSEVADLDLTVRRLGEAGLDASVTLERQVPFGPVMHRQAALLRASGCIGPAQRDERIAVVRAVAPGVRQDRPDA